ncbi:hypothetical protein HPB48_017287 [Haemaphysalis longicornis]|uniref:Ionotropic receptor n=1 Tax=Haemaphysalis longicornis TaxID=44386 RepID=A0A9J6H3N6_HAELO|nr:hypothetical protein HPB48_017287 [Haemaphysalis longicornis]
MRCVKYLILCALYQQVFTSNVHLTKHLGNFLEDQSLLHMLPNFSHNMELHVVIPRCCLEGNFEIVQMFLKNEKLPAKMFFTDLERVPDDPPACHMERFTDDRFEHQVCRRVLLFADCGHTSWGTHMRRTPPKYASYMIIDLMNRTRGNCGVRSRDPLCVYLREVDVYIAQYNDKQVSVHRHEDSQCESFVPGSANRRAASTRFSQRPLGNASLSLHCLYATTCELPSIRVFIDALHYKNAAVTVKERSVFDTTDADFVRHFLKCIGPYGVIHNPGSTVRQLLPIRRMHPHVTLVRPTGSAENRHFARKLPRVPKTAILILAFQWPLWLGLVICYVCFCLFLTIHPRFYGYQKTGAVGVAAWLVSSLLNQSATLVTATSTKSSLRLLLGAWLLKSLLMSSAFRSALMSMLENIPTRGRLPEFTTISNKVTSGYTSYYLICGKHNLCGCKQVIYKMPGTTGVCWVENSVRRSSERVYVMDEFSRELTENLTQILDAFGYVFLGQNTFDWVTGPVVTLRSPFKDAIATVTTQAFEGGLFEAPTALVNFKFLYRRALVTLNSSKQAAGLNTKSFELHFVVLLGGFVMSLTVFVLEILCSGYSPPNLRGVKKYIFPRH